MSQRITDLHRKTYEAQRDESVSLIRDQGPRGPKSPIETTSPIRLKDVIDSIPKYDGYKMSVYFCKMCERALNLISMYQQYYMVQLILNKLLGMHTLLLKALNILRYMN